MTFNTFLAAVGGTSAAAALQADSDSTLLLASLGLTAAALFFLALELFLPSGGILALLTGACAISSIIVMFMFDDILGLLNLAAYVLIGPFVLYWSIRIWERSPIGRKLILGATEEGLDSGGESVQRSESERRERVDSIRSFIGDHGVADTQLRPVGFVRIDGHRIDAIAEGDVIEAGARIRVVEAYDNQVKVRAVEDNDADAAPK